MWNNIVYQLKALSTSWWMRSAVLASLVAAAVLLQAARVAFSADVTSTWDGSINNWSLASHWSNVPTVSFFPQNGNGGFTYDASVSGGRVTLDQNIAINKLSLAGGTISGSNNLNLASGINWTAGGFSGLGQTTINGGTISGSATKYLDSRTLSVAGNIDWSAGDILRTSSMATRGTVVVENGNTFTASGPSGTNRNLAANLQVNSGGKFVTTGSHATFVAHVVFDGPGGTLVNNGIVEAGPNTTLSVPGVSGNGTFIVRNNAVLNPLLDAAGDFQFTGSVVLDNGIFDVLVWNGGNVQFLLPSYLSGTGQVFVDTLINTRQISPGISIGGIGAIDVKGNYKQAAQGILAMDISGTSSSQFDKLNVLGTAELGGTLKVDLTNLSILPAAGTLVPLLTSSSLSGSFGSVVSTGNKNVFVVGKTMGTTAYAEFRDRGDMDGVNGFNSIDYDLFAYGLMNPNLPKFHDHCLSLSPGSACTINPQQGGDFSGNGRLDFDDIAGFQARLSSLGYSPAPLMAAIDRYTRAVPEPNSAVLAIIAGIVATAGCGTRWTQAPRPRRFPWADQRELER